GTNAGIRRAHSQSVCRLTSLPRNRVSVSIQASTEVALTGGRLSGRSVVVVAISVSLPFAVSPARFRHRPGEGPPRAGYLFCEPFPWFALAPCWALAPCCAFAPCRALAPCWALAPCCPAA